MARPDFLSQLPSLEELLENPRVAAAVERVSRSAATQVRTAVARLASEVSRRTEELKGLGAGELFDRLLKQLDQPSTPGSSHVINATGSFFRNAEWQPPLPATALDAATASSNGFRLSSNEETCHIAARLLGCEKASVFSSPAAAMAIAFEALASGGACVIARGEMAELAPGVRLDDIARRSGIRLCEVGATDIATAEDYGRALDRLRSEGIEPTLVLRRLSVACDGLPTLAELAAVADTNGSLLIADVGDAPPTESMQAYGYEGVTAEGALASGAAGIVMDTAGRLGGPLGGLFGGRGSVIDAIMASPASSADLLDPLVSHVLAATLRLFEQPEQLRFSHPLYQLLDAPLDNLRVRAERIAALITGADGVAKAIAAERVASERISWGVLIEPASGVTAADLQARLACQDPRVEARIDGPAVILDLSAVFASQDRDLIRAFVPDSDGGDPVS